MKIEMGTEVKHEEFSSKGLKFERLKHTPWFDLTVDCLNGFIGLFENAGIFLIEPSLKLGFVVV